MTSKEYLESKGLCDHDYMDSGMINYISEMMEEYHQAKLKLLDIPPVIDTLQNCPVCLRGIFVDRVCNNCGADKLTE